MVYQQYDNNMTTKEAILTIINNNVKREGVDKLIKFLEESDYFTAPASVAFHSSHEGGLAEHSLQVYKNLIHKNEYYKLEYSDETIAIAGLLHDACKCWFYEKADSDPITDAQLRYLCSMAPHWQTNNSKLTKRYASKLIDHYKNNGTVDEEPEFTTEWKVNDQLPIGHGEKSMFIIQKFIDLTDDEAMAIRWHMIAFDAGVHFDYPSGYVFRKAADECKLLTILFTADYEADKILKT